MTVVLLALLWGAMMAPSAWAAADEKKEQEEGGRWSVGLSAGSYSPRLNSFNNALERPGLVIQQDPNFLIPRNETLTIALRDVATPPLSSGINYGLEAQWEWRPRISFVIMALNWQGRSTKSDTITMQLRSNLPPLDVPRTARYNLNLNQLWAGWRFTLFQRPDRGKVFINLGIAGIAVADLTMDSLLIVRQGEDLRLPAFASISSAELHGTGFSSRYGLGGEVFLNKNVSLGFQTNYIIGTLQRITVSRFFPSGFSELPPTPPETTNSLPDNVVPANHAPPNLGDQLSTAEVVVARETTELIENPTKLTLDLSGWEVSFSLRVYY